MPLFIWDLHLIDMIKRESINSTPVCFLLYKYAVEILLTALYNYAVAAKVFLGEANSNVGDLFTVDLDAALLDIAAGVTVGGAQTADNKQVNCAYSAVLAELFGRNFGSGHISDIAAAGEQTASGFLSLVGLFLGMNKSGKLVSKDLLSLVQLAAFPAFHLLNLLKGQEGKHLEALDNVSVINVSPVLVEIVGAGLVGIKPNSAGSGLTHLLALRVEEQSDGHCVSVLTQLTADKLGTAKHVAPLVIAAELHVAAVMLVQVVEVVALHDHVVELKEAQTLLHTLLVALGAEHVVDGEACANLAKQLNVVQVQQPIGVVDHAGFAIAKLDELLHLALEAICVVIDVFLSEHLTHIGTTGGVTDHGGAAADEGDRLVAGHLQALHKAKSHEVTYMQAVCGTVKTNVEGCVTGIDKIGNLFLVSYLGNKTAGNEFFINSHFSFSYIQNFIFTILCLLIPAAEILRFAQNDKT